MPAIPLLSTSPTWVQSAVMAANNWFLRRDAARVQRQALLARAQRSLQVPIPSNDLERSVPTPVLDVELDLAQRVRLVGEW